MARFTYIALFLGTCALRVLSCPAKVPIERSHLTEQKAEQALSTKSTSPDGNISDNIVTKTVTGSTLMKPLTSKTNRPTPNTAIPMANTAPKAKDEVTYDGCQYNVPGAGKFKHKEDFIFNDGLPEGLEIAQYLVADSFGGAPFDHEFETENVIVDNHGFLNLKVPGVRRPKPYDGQVISSSEVLTSEKNILHASVRTSAIFSTVPGTCQGIFFYKNDNQETDIEYLSDPFSEANNINQTSEDGDPIPLWYSNQALTKDTTATQEIGPAPRDVTQVHEYRIDWTKDFTAFYIDGALTKKLTTNIPTEPGQWIWNHWANGDQAWSSGPPKKDSFFKIQKITMYYNISPENKKC